MGGYRTPAQLWSLGLLWPASDTLHHSGHPERSISLIVCQLQPLDIDLVLLRM